LENNIVVDIEPITDEIKNRFISQNFINKKLQKLGAYAKAFL
jgi:hypothetical protein